jgi:predicted Zn-dependent protease
MAALFMSLKVTVERNVGTAVSLILAFDLEQIVHLVFEWNRYLHKCYSSAAERASITIVLQNAPLPTVDATFAKSIAALIAFPRVKENILANGANKVCHHVLVSFKDKSFKSSLRLLLCQNCRRFLINIVNYVRWL